MWQWRTCRSLSSPGSVTSVSRSTALGIEQAQQPFRVEVISGAYPPMKAGEADHCYRIAAQLTDRGVHVEVVTTAGLKLSGQERVRSEIRDWSWRDLPLLLWTVWRYKPDAVLLYYIGFIYNDHPMITFFPSLCKMVSRRARVVVMFAYPHGSKVGKQSFLSRVLRRVVKWGIGAQGVDNEFGTLLRDSDAIIVLSQRHQQMLSEHDSSVAVKCALVPPPPLLKMTTRTDQEARRATRAQLGFSAEQLVLVYFGMIYPPKGIETLLKAFHVVSRVRPQARLLLVGGVLAHEYPDRPRFAEEMRAMPERLGFGDKVVWTGEFETESDEASRFLYASDMCVFSADLGLYLNNSSFAAVAAHGLPVVATKAEMVESPFAEGVNVLWCPPKSPDEMAAAILRVIDDPGLRRQLGEGARQLASDWFSWDAATDRTMALLQGRAVVFAEEKRDK